MDINRIGNIILIIVSIGVICCGLVASIVLSDLLYVGIGMGFFIGVVVAVAVKTFTQKYVMKTEEPQKEERPEEPSMIEKITTFGKKKREEMNPNSEAAIWARVKERERKQKEAVRDEGERTSDYVSKTVEREPAQNVNWKPPIFASGVRKRTYKYAKQSP